MTNTTIDTTVALLLRAAECDASAQQLRSHAAALVSAMGWKDRATVAQRSGLSPGTVAMLAGIGPIAGKKHA